MRRIVALLLLAAFGVFTWLVWMFQPWMPAGRTVHLSTFSLGGHDFQVWQRKNPDTFEPFATGLFVRDGTNDWRVFLLDFEDTYRPRVWLRREDSGIAVFLRGGRLGLLDERATIFTRKSDGAVFQATAIGREPPGDWWLGQ